MLKRTADFFLSPDRGLRTYRLHFYALVIGLVEAIAGFYWKVEPSGLALVIGASLTPVAAASAWNNVGVTKAQNSGGGAAPGGSNQTA